MINAISRQQHTRIMLAARIHAISAMLVGAGGELSSLAHGEDAFEDPGRVDDVGDPINRLAAGIDARIEQAQREVQSCLRVLELWSPRGER